MSRVKFSALVLTANLVLMDEFEVDHIVVHPEDRLQLRSCGGDIRVDFEEQWITELSDTGGFAAIDSKGTEHGFEVRMDRPLTLADVRENCGEFAFEPVKPADQYPADTAHTWKF